MTRRLRDDAETGAYAAQRRAEGKNARDVRRCLKRAVAQQLFKLLERITDPAWRSWQPDSAL
jgi:hypothetical protein